MYGSASYAGMITLTAGMISLVVEGGGTRPRAPHGPAAMMWLALPRLRCGQVLTVRWLRTGPRHSGPLRCPVRRTDRRQPRGAWPSAALDRRGPVQPRQLFRARWAPRG